MTVSTTAAWLNELISLYLIIYTHTNMKQNKLYTCVLSLALLAGILSSCQDEDTFGAKTPAQMPITLSGEIEQLAISRVNDNGFCDGDEMGVYIVDYEGNTPGILQNTGNRGTNVKHTFDEAAYKWNSAYDVYWKDDHTPIDIYGYYPFGSPADVNAYEFTVEKDQAKAAEGDNLGGYEASDFLWGKAEKVAPTERVIRLPMYHRMANARVTLEKGDGFADGEWEKLEKHVLVKNTVREAVISLADGVVKPNGAVEETGTIPFQHGDEFRAIVVPQSVEGGKDLFAFTVGGSSYTFRKEETFTYNPGKMHNFTIRVNKKSSSGQYEFKLMGESITPWEADMASHDATAKEYIVINSSAGHLRDSIIAANKDFRELQNLKITGEINSDDFYFMRDSMDVLQSLNLKEVRCLHGQFGGRGGDFPNGSWEYEDDIIPESALNEKSTLLRIVLPDKLKKIGDCAFRSCVNLTGSINIPEGVTHIGASAFLWDKSLTGTLTLPSTLEYIGGGGAVDIGGAFDECKFTCELKLPNNLRYIGHNAFAENTGLYGNLILPSKLEFLGDFAFDRCNNLTGDLEIPQGVTYLCQGSFQYTGLNGILKLHDGITGIQNDVFNGAPLKGELILPRNLVVLGERAFQGCDFSGTLVLPKKLTTIGNNAFSGNWRLMGTLEIPENVQTIGNSAFSQCRSIEGLIFPEGLENIMDGAFNECYGIGSIVCKGSVPAHVQASAFNGVAKDNFAVEVPEPAVQQYQAAAGWSDFKRITAHHELVCRPNLANAINTECKRTLVIDAEGDWEVSEMPDWCSLSAMSGSTKSELTLTIHSMTQGSAPRTGDIVFRLKEKDYTARCTVSQYDYEYGEDEVITLQRATKGNRGGINLVFLGDGYDAKDISEGNYLQTMREQMENFFAIEPYKTYRDYFNAYTAIAVSPESGIGTVNTIRYAKFETTYTGGVGLRCDYDAAFQYAVDMNTTVTRDNLKESLLIMVPNSTDYGGICQMYEDGSAIAFCPLSTYGYPLDTRGVIQHEAGGHGFGKLGDEYIYHNEFIDFCGCTCCGHVFEFNWAKSLGWYENLSLTGKMHEVPWSHLIFDEKYADFVDVFEGGFMHNRGVFRSEQNSCMNNDIPYYSTISREAIVRRIMDYAGEEYTFEKFKANDKVEVDATTRAASMPYAGYAVRGFQHAPRIVKGSPRVK